MSLDYRNCIRFASKYLPKNAVAIDVGCNINPIVEMNYADWYEKSQLTLWNPYENGVLWESKDIFPEG